MKRVVLITGAASGIGWATAERFRAVGDRVITADLRDADIIADLATGEGRLHLAQAAAAQAPDGIDTVIAAAGIVAADPCLTVAVNFFGAVATLSAVRPLLARTAQPRAVVVISTAALLPVNDAVVAACLNGDEPAARAAALASPGDVYASSKRALALWLRQGAAGPDWAGSGILLNAVSPGTVRTPMTAPILATDEGRALLARVTPIAVADYGQPADIAEVLHFLGSFSGGYLLGQNLYVDGGTDVLMRPAQL